MTDFSGYLFFSGGKVVDGVTASIKQKEIFSRLLTPRGGAGVHGGIF